MKKKVFITVFSSFCVFSLCNKLTKCEEMNSQFVWDTMCVIYMNIRDNLKKWNEIL